MEHPTLRMFHKWLGYNLFHRDDIRKVRVGDLQLLYAAINKIPTSPVTLLVSHWLSIPRLNLLEYSSLEFIDELRIYLGYDTFRQARVTPQCYGCISHMHNMSIIIYSSIS